MIDDHETRRAIALDMSIRKPLVGKKFDGYFNTSYGHELYWQKILPNGDIKAILFYFHGYADHSSWFIHDHMMKFVEKGYLVVAADCRGHGKSTGLHCYIDSFDLLILELKEHILNQMSTLSSYNKSIFFVGESMGAMCATKVYSIISEKDILSSFKGIVLIAPLLGMGPNSSPSPVLRAALNVLAFLFPSKPWVPQAVANDKAVKDENVRKEALLNKLYYRAPPRCKTALELLVASESMSELSTKSTFSFLICHGSGDVITSPIVSQNFFKNSPSEDKTYLLYDGVWHAMLSGEPESTRNKVYNDIFEWLGSRVGKESMTANRFDKIEEFSNL